jgi:hypothetical protein
MCQLWDKWGQEHLWKVQGSELLQFSVPETALEEWPQGNVYRSRKEATSSNEFCPASEKRRRW